MFCWFGSFFKKIFLVRIAVFWFWKFPFLLQILLFDCSEYILLGFVWAKECCLGLFQHFSWDFRGEFCNSKHSFEDSQKFSVSKFSESATVSVTRFSFGLLRWIQNFHQFLSAFRIHCFCQRRKMHSTAHLLQGVTLIFERGQIWPLLKLYDFGISISLLPPRAQRPYHSAKKSIP